MAKQVASRRTLLRHSIIVSVLGKNSDFLRESHTYNRINLFLPKTRQSIISANPTINSGCTNIVPGMVSIPLVFRIPTHFLGFSYSAFQLRKALTNNKGRDLKRLPAEEREFLVSSCERYKIENLRFKTEFVCGGSRLNR